MLITQLSKKYTSLTATKIGIETGRIERNVEVDIMDVAVVAVVAAAVVVVGGGGVVAAVGVATVADVVFVGRLLLDKGSCSPIDVCRVLDR